MVTAIFRRMSKVEHTRTKGRRLGKGREEDNVPASHGNERKAELTLPYGYLSCEEEKRNWRKKEGERRKRGTIKR
jgi:hypothetical protein